MASPDTNTPTATSSSDDDVVRMEKEIVSLESEMDDLEEEITTIQSENAATKAEIETLLQTPAGPDDMGRIELGILGVELLALKVYLTNLVKEEIDCKNKLKDRTDKVLKTAYELHALLKRQLASRRKQLAEAQAMLEQASIATCSSPPAAE